MSIAETNPALEDLKRVIYNGRLSEDLEIEGVRLNISTLSADEELAVYSETQVNSVSEMSQNDRKSTEYMLAIAKRAIRKVNGTTVTTSELSGLLGKADVEFLQKIFIKFTELIKRKITAGTEIKN
jgi:hypothetical protein